MINADDFGYSDAVNRAIAKAYDQGILTSTSLMVKAEAAKEAIALAKERPGLGVGLHPSSNSRNSGRRGNSVLR